MLKPLALFAPVLLGSLLACAAPVPVVTDPLEGVDPVWSNPEAAEGFALLAELRSPELDDLLAEALGGGSPDLRAASARMEAAAALAGAAQGALWPTLGFDLQNSRSTRNLRTFGIAIPPGVDPITTVSSVSGAFAASWELDAWGRIRETVEAAEQDLAVGYWDLEAARVSLAGQLVRGWFALGEARAQRDLAERTLASWRRSEEQLQQRFEAGVGRALDLHLLRTSVATAEAGLEAAREAEQLALRALEALAGRVAEGSLEAGAVLLADVPAAPSSIDATSLGLRPDLRAAESRTAAELARSSVARADLWPRISFTATTGWTGTEAEHVGDPDFSVWSFVGGITAPLFQGGALRARIQAADSTVRATLAAWEGLVIRACAEVERARIQMGASDLRFEALVRAAEEARAAEALATEQYEAGLVGIIEVLEAQRRQLAVESEVLRALRLRHEARVDLWLALGGHGVASCACCGGADEGGPALDGGADVASPDLLEAGS